MLINEWCKNISKWRKEKKFYTPTRIDSESLRDAMLGKLMLVVTEIAEAAEAVRHNDMDNFIEEIADTQIRIMDIAGSCGIDLENAITKKMKINQERPIRHNKKCSL